MPNSLHRRTWPPFPTMASHTTMIGIPTLVPPTMFTPDLSTFTHHENYQGSDQLRVGNGKGLPIAHIGSSQISNSQHNFKLSNVLHVPTLTKSLLSVHQFCKDNNVFFEFHPSTSAIKDQVSKTPLLSGLNKDGLLVCTSFLLQQLHHRPHLSIVLNMSPLSVGIVVLGTPIRLLFVKINCHFLLLVLVLFVRLAN